MREWRPISRSTRSEQGVKYRVRAMGRKVGLEIPGFYPVSGGISSGGY